MNTSRSNRRPRRRHRLRLLAAATAVLTLLGTAGAAAARPDEPTAPAPAGAAATADGLRAVSLPGLTRSTYTITLITGDEVTLTRDGGRYIVTAIPAARADGTRPTIDVEVRTGPGGTDTLLHALPSDAQALVAGGVVDRKIFDVAWLAAQVERGANTPLGITVKYGDRLDAAALDKRVSGLPGATTAAKHPESGTVDLRVDPRQAATFWAGFKGKTGVGELSDYLFDRVTPKLGGDAVALWPTGLRSEKAEPQTDTGQPTYRVTQTYKRTNGEPFYCGTRLMTICPTFGFLLAQVAGNAVGSGYESVSARCLDNDPCTTFEATFEVPPGTYQGGGHALFRLDGRDQQLNLELPEFTVTGDTTLTRDADAARQLTVGTPRPTETFVASRTTFRTFSNGQGGGTLSFTGYGNSSFWAIPSPPVTVGTFHLGTNWVLGKPMVTMTATTPKRVALKPMLPTYWYRSPGFEVVRFSGRQTLQLVDGGLGRAADYDRITAKGKIVLLRIDADKPAGGQCNVGTEQLMRARTAGAVAVLVDPISSGGPWPTTVCPMPVAPDWWSSPQEVADIPYAAISTAEAENLRGLLRRGPVKIDVSGYDSVSPYVYTLHIYQEGRIPTSLHTEVTDKQLAKVDTSLHGTQAQPASLIYSAFRPNETAVAGVPYSYLTDSVRFTTYRGPVSPDLVRNQFYEPSGGQPGVRTIDVADRAGPASARWTSRPLVPGAPALSPQIFRSQPGKWEGDWSNEICAFCRQGDTFYPITYLVSGAAPDHLMGSYVFEPQNVHMYADGQELPQANSLIWGATYHLPAEPRRYRLTAHNGATTTTWNFTSAAATRNEPPKGSKCPEGSGSPCHADPLLFLRYDVGADLGDAVTAPGRHQITVTAYHQVAAAPAVKRVALAISTDGGVTWKTLPTKSRGGGNHTASYQVPQLADTTGTVSIRASAEDADGNTVEQTVLDAFRLTSRR
ncbi:PA domain-containing protein [Micromonospora echinaurantiaca]|uniref:PA domain-containing protein n=1 Tax=Micromonospora echinaurantiaca TaxID=47857 RepID=A0A1C5HGM8_9ACTN|nr:hypothetical protein [Micromonospora echinaurantiaca]SCG44661.1 PA domain-containing protein [Micromonospora echinaurantiaca]